MAAAPQIQVSLVLKAGFPPIKTVVLPTGKILAVGWWPDGGKAQTWLSVATAAGIPAIRTVGTPGPTIVPPCVVVSVTRAAAGISRMC